MINIKFNRPEILFPCFAQLISLPGIGPKTAKTMAKRIGLKVIDMAFYFPVSIIDRTASPDLDKIIDGQVVTLSLTVLSLNIPTGRQTHPARIIAGNQSGRIEIIYL